MRKCRPEIGRRLPDRIVQIGRAFANRAVKPGGDEARLTLHELRVILPGLEKFLLVRLFQYEHIHQHDGRDIDCDLTFDREGGVERAQQRHETLLSIWLHVVAMV